METRTKYADGCWTCRIRRKKCDEARPICSNCQSLEIACLYQDTKPQWMDGGVKQAEMLENIKAEVKQRAAYRRSRQHIKALSKGIDDDDSLVGVMQTTTATSTVNRLLSTPIPTPTETAPSSPPQELRTPSNAHHSSDANIAANSARPIRTFMTTSRLQSESDWSPHLQDNISLGGSSEIPSLIHPVLFSDSSSLIKEDDQFWFMTFLDFVMPSMFPLYKPRLVDGGRTWMLSLLIKNKALYHTALGLSSYFFSIAVSTEHSGHSICKMQSWENLSEQMDTAFKVIKRDLEEVTLKGIENNLLDGARLMESIIQLLNIEVAIARCENWQFHLDAAISLFEQIFQHHGTEGGLSAILREIGRLTWNAGLPHPQNHELWTPDQASFLFFTAILLFQDVIGSTSLGQAPRLQVYHSVLLGPSNGTGTKTPIELENFIGCQNWVILLIGEISSLDAWKRQCKCEGRLSTMELARKAHGIEQRLQQGIIHLEDESPCNREYTGNLIDAMTMSSHQPYGEDIQLALTRIWAHATQAYLYVTVSGLQLASPELRRSVVRTIELLTALPNPTWLRVVVWPFCLTGCLASQEEEQIFRNMVMEAGPLRSLGGLQNALKIMENVWFLRAGAYSSNWDLSWCFGILGHPAFLL